MKKRKCAILNQSAAITLPTMSIGHIVAALVCVLLVILIGNLASARIWVGLACVALVLVVLRLI